ncbi:pyrroloquinoline-quinone synthase [Marinobacter daqiaonensis]|uniref:Pyrroloquinoline-quinone synthase n=1 Tax=Marinobacter daqiaonensis TaxID=650891 RepID=A0A1I6GUH8_9GAMM|nr:iron-containing redox enzyme family protein [Marinobacter daqiaonensis]SFR45776.1 pyrroloquinoline-quinone synthase [Marinobacter daqiaonensis]
MLMERNEFRAELNRTLQHNLTLSHPLFALLLNADNPDIHLLRKVALQGYQLTRHFLTYIEHLFFFCPLPKHKRHLLFNMFEEETGRLSRTKNHVHLMEDFLRALGISDQERDKVTALPATQELIDYRMDACTNPERYHIGAAAVLVASEGQNLETLGEDARHTILGRVFGLQEKDLLFFSVHQKEDVAHVRQGLDLVADLCTTAAMQKEALFAVNHTCRLFYGMYEGIYQTLGQPEQAHV